MHVYILEQCYFIILNMFISNINYMNLNIDMYIIFKYILYVPYTL